jgi:hypothetical protein
MIFNFETRPADSPYIEAVWRNHCENGGPFISMAVGQWGLVVTKYNGQTSLTVRGPESKATSAYCPPGAEHYGMYLKLGTYIPYLPTDDLRDGGITLPDSAGNSFWLNSRSWQIPEYQNLEIFASRLVRQGLLVQEHNVNAALRGIPTEQSIRSTQRKFLRAVGLTHGVINQIDRARHATMLLKQGYSIIDTIRLAGYSDQPHLTRSLKYYIGQTPAQLLEERDTVQLSYLSKTT